MKKVLLTSALLLASSSAFAADDYSKTMGSKDLDMKEGTERPWNLTLGVAVGAKNEHLGSDDVEVIALPYITADYSFTPDFSVFVSPYAGVGAEYDLNEKVEIGANFDYRAGRDASNDTYLTGTPDVDGTVEFGPYVNYKMGRVTLGLDSKFDIADEHNGWLVEASAKYKAPLDKCQCLFGGVGVSTTYGSEDYMETYFDVSPANAVANRPAFDADAGFQDVTISSDLTYMLTRKHFITAVGEVAKLIGDASDSPISQDDTQIRAFLAYGYKF